MSNCIKKMIFHIKLLKTGFRQMTNGDKRLVLSCYIMVVCGFGELLECRYILITYFNMNDFNHKPTSYHHPLSAASTFCTSTHIRKLYNYNVV